MQRSTRQIGNGLRRNYQGPICFARVADPLVMDAHLAALALEHGAELASSDRDFSRFAGLKLINPLLGVFDGIWLVALKKRIRRFADYTA